MSVSSDKCLRVLERLSLRQIQRLVETLHLTTLHRRQFIEARYKEHAPYFSETLQFLKDLNWVVEAGDELIVSGECQTLAASVTTKSYVAERIVQAMMLGSDAYKNVLAEYLVQFKVIGNVVIHRPAARRRLEESGIRNFLIDLRMVSYRGEDDSFVLHHNHVDLYLWAKNVKSLKSKKQFRARLSDREELGASAECAVFQHEKTRVGDRWAAQVEYVSAMYPFACYDVKSLTLDSEKTIPRYIEVKAVSAESYEFFWSATELEAARLLGNKYFLYLLPVITGSFDFSKLLILENPYITVYKNSESWLTEDNVILCRRKQ